MGLRWLIVGFALGLLISLAVVWIVIQLGQATTHGFHGTL